MHSVLNTLLHNPCRWFAIEALGDEIIITLHDTFKNMKYQVRLKYTVNALQFAIIAKQMHKELDDAIKAKQ